MNISSSSTNESDTIKLNNHVCISESNTEESKQAEKTPADPNFLKVEETKKQQQRAGAKPSKTMNKKKFLIRRDTPMDLTKKHLKKQNGYMPAFTEKFAEATVEES